MTIITTLEGLTLIFTSGLIAGLSYWIGKRDAN